MTAKACSATPSAKRLCVSPAPLSEALIEDRTADKDNYRPMPADDWQLLEELLCKPTEAVRQHLKSGLALMLSCHVSRAPSSVFCFGHCIEEYRASFTLSAHQLIV